MLWLAAALLAVRPQAHAQEPEAVLPEKDAYVAMLKADGLRDRGDAAQALENYAEAIRLFREVQTSNPTYKASNIAYRLDYCIRQAEQLRPTPAQGLARAQPPEPATPPAPADPGNETGEETLRTLQADLRRMEMEVARYRKLEGEYTDLRDRMIRLQQAARELRDAVGRRDEDLAAARLETKTEREERIRLGTALEELKQAAIAALEEARKRDEELAEARAGAASSADAVRIAETRAEELDAEIKQIRAAQAQLENAANAARAEAEEAGRRLKDVSAERDSERDRAAEHIERSAAEVRQARADLGEAQATTDRLQAQVESLIRERDEAAASADAIRDELERAGMLAAELNRELELWQGRAREATAGRQAAEGLQADAERAAAEARAESRKHLERISALEREISKVAELAESVPENPVPPPVDPPVAEAAEAAAERAAEPEPEELANARNLMRSGDLPGAYALIQALLADAPNHLDALADAAQCAYRLGMEQDAIGHYQRLLTARPDHARANFNLAVIYALANPPQLDLARSHYERARLLGEPRDEKLERQLGR